MRILVAYDGSPAANAAIDEVLRRPWPEGSEIRLVRVVERPVNSPPDGRSEITPLLVERVCSCLVEDACGAVRDVLGKFGCRGDLAVTCEFRDGQAKEVLLQMIEDWRPDLVVAGLNSARHASTPLLGSVCYALITCAPCNVEVVRPAAAA